MRKIAVLGSTGSIGTQALEVIEENHNELTAEILTCNSNLTLMKQQLTKFKPRYAVLPDNDDARKLADSHRSTVFLYGSKGLEEVSKNCEYDFMLNSLLGISGFVPTYNALSTKRDVALANKETLVAGGQIIMDKAYENNLSVIPVDSEHSAIFQCIQGAENKIKKLTLTASGGPFRGMNRTDLSRVTLKQALRHPNWSMGNKITIDSATLMNKGFEVIEAKWLFDVEAEDIEVVVHPESIIHSMVEFSDNSTLAQLGQPDMKIPISYAFSYPDRWETSAESIDLIKTGSLNFYEPDLKTFKCLNLALQSISSGESYPIVLNAANEILVDSFLNEKISFLDIGDHLEKILNEHKQIQIRTVEDVMAVDKDIRTSTEKMINGGII